MSITASIRKVGPPSLLIVDDEPAVLDTTKKLLERRGHAVTACGSAKDALSLLAVEVFDALLTDVHMPGMDGLELLRTVRERGLRLPVVVMTGNPTASGAAEASNWGAFRYLSKPLSVADLHHVIMAAIGEGSTSG